MSETWESRFVMRLRRTASDALEQVGVAVGSSAAVTELPDARPELHGTPVAHPALRQSNKVVKTPHTHKKKMTMMFGNFITDRKKTCVEHKAFPLIHLLWLIVISLTRESEISLSEIMNSSSLASVLFLRDSVPPRGHEDWKVSVALIGVEQRSWLFCNCTE